MKAIEPMIKFTQINFGEKVKLTRKKFKLPLITPTSIIREYITLNLDTAESENLRERQKETGALFVLLHVLLIAYSPHGFAMHIHGANQFFVNQILVS